MAGSPRSMAPGRTADDGRCVEAPACALARPTGGPTCHKHDLHLFGESLRLDGADPVGCRDFNVARRAWATWLFCLLLVLASPYLAAPLLCVTAAAGAEAETQARPALTQPEIDSLVDRISSEVVRRLKTEGAVTVAPEGTAAVAPAGGAIPEEPIDRESVRLFARAGAILAAFPELGAQLARVPGLLTSDAGQRSLGLYALLVALSVAIAVGAEVVLRILTTGLRRRLDGAMYGWRGIASLVVLAALDAAGLLVVWLASYALLTAWFPGSEPQSRLASLILVSVFSWRLYMFAFRLVLRPALHGARLAEIDDRDANAIYRTLGLAILLVLALRVVVLVITAIKAPAEVVALAGVVSAVITALGFILAALAMRAPVGRWIMGVSFDPAAHPVRAVIARHWVAVAIPFFGVLALAKIYGALAARPMVPEALALTLDVIVGVLLLESAIGKASKLLRRYPGGAVEPDAGPEPATLAEPLGARRPLRLSERVARCLRVAIYIGAGVLVAEAWVVDVLDLARSWDLGAVTAAVATVGGTVLAAVCAFEAVGYLTDRFAAGARKPALPGQQDGEEADTSLGVTRLATLMPLLRVALLITICVLAVLTILSQLGFNVTALVAGASIVGLALSFGSQTLVKDIVSGVFYLVDDAFRVGEYIDCGKAKGTVEGFTLRSLRLRHQNGQVHTIPFGQLGQITNFSRDWTTMKFNLRFVRSTDIELLRKTTKRIGQEMLQDPEMKDEVLVPLKMQGVTDIDDNALVVRFKFTVRPSKPTFVQREALKRMFREFPSAEIEFANAMVAIQNIGQHDEALSGAAAASVVRAKAEAARTLVPDAS